jgi:ABC-type molybdate transport system ATPase subunit
LSEWLNRRALRWLGPRMIDLRFALRLGELDLDVDVALPPRGISAIFGRSGAGKSSLINAVAGIVQPTRGRISVADRVFFDHDAGINLPIEARGIGYVFQDSRLFPHLSVAGNLRYGLKRARGPRPVDWDSVIERARSHPTCSTAGRITCPVANGSASRSAGPCCASRHCC